MKVARGKAVFVMLVFTAIFVALIGVWALVLAQDNVPNAPRSWAELFMLVLGGAFGVPAIIKAIRGGINWKTLLSSGTVYTAISGIFTAIGLYMSSAIELPTLIGAIYLAVATIFLRNAQANNGQTTVAWWSGEKRPE